MPRRIALLAAVALLLGATQAEDPRLAEVQACAERNVPGKSSVQKLRFLSVDRTGSERTLEAKLSWKKLGEGKQGTLISVEAPPNVRGSAHLILQEDGREEMFVYLPEFKKVRRIHPNTASGSLFGTDFSYEDARYLRDAASQLGGQRLDDAELEGRPVYVIQTRPTAESESGYQRIDAFVDRETCVPLKVEFYASEGEPQKILTVDPAALTQADGRWYPAAMVLRNLADETETRLTVDDVAMDGDIADRLFTLGNLERGR